MDVRMMQGADDSCIFSFERRFENIEAAGFVLIFKNALRDAYKKCDFLKQVHMCCLYKQFVRRNSRHCSRLRVCSWFTPFNETLVLRVIGFDRHDLR